jgi:hypothetical protein
MVSKKKFLQCRRGIEAFTSIFMLLLMFAVLMGLIVAFFSYNRSTQETMDVEQERSQERIELSGLKLDEQGLYLSNLTIVNTGTIEVRIRAIYNLTNGEVSFLCDPSTLADTHIAPGKSLSIDLSTLPFAVPFAPDAKIIAATERGVKTMDYESLLLLGPVEHPPHYDPTKLYCGPLMLQFDSFYYQEYNKQGSPVGDWKPGWVVPVSIPCAWKINLMDIETREITINKTSCFTTISSGSSDVRSWFLESTSQNLIVNETTSVIFKWSDPEAQKDVGSMYPSSTVCMVFLTFSGYFHEQNGTTTPYAQSIPFEAAITVK